LLFVFYLLCLPKSGISDTTELKYSARGKESQLIIKKAYLDPYLDMFNGKILSYRLSKSTNAKAVLDDFYEVIE